MARQHLILNIGLARCGTTATEDYFRALSGFSTPVGVKELKFFLQPADPQSYRTLFTDPQGDMLFESSPPYMGGGPKRFSDVLARVQALTDHGFDVTILVLVRNFLARAFSHYWHDISSQYALYGRYWSVQTKDDPRRFARVYDRSFLAELSLPRSDAKFLPKVSQMVEAAIAVLGSHRVRIAHTHGLDAALADLFGQIGLAHRLPLAPVPRLRGSRASMVLTRGLSGGPATIPTRTGPRQIIIHPGQAVLVQDKAVEILPADRFELEQIAKAAQCWTHSFDPADLPPRVLDYLNRQRRAFARLPRECFLAGQRPEILQDIAALPERMEIAPPEPDPDLFPGGLCG